MADLFQEFGKSLEVDLGKTFSSILNIVGIEEAQRSGRSQHVPNGALPNAAATRQNVQGLLPPPPLLRTRPPRVRSRFVRAMISGRAFGESTAATEEGAPPEIRESEESGDELEGRDEQGAEEPGGELVEQNEESAEENGEGGDGSDDPLSPGGITSDNDPETEEPEQRENQGELTSENEISEEEPEHHETDDVARSNQIFRVESVQSTVSENMAKADRIAAAEEEWKERMKPTRRPSAVVTGSKPRQGKLVWNGSEWVPMTLEMFQGAKFIKAIDKRSERFYWSCKERNMTVWEEPIKVLLQEALHLVSRKEYDKGKDILMHVMKKSRPESETHERAKMALHEVDRHAGVKRTHIETKSPYDHTANEYSDVWDGTKWRPQKLEWCMKEDIWKKGEAYGKPYWSAKDIGDGVVTWYAPHWFICDEAIKLMEEKELNKAKEMFDVAKARCEPGERLPGRIRTEIRTNNYFLGIANDGWADAQSMAASSAAGSTKSLMEDTWPLPKPQRVDDVWDGVQWGPMTHDVAMADGWEMGKDHTIKEKYWSNKNASVVSWTNPREFIYEEGKKRWKKKQYAEARKYFERVSALTKKFGGGTYKATPTYLETIGQRIKAKEEEERVEKRRQKNIARGIDPDAPEEELNKAARKLRRASLASAASQLENLHPAVLPRWVKETDYWDGREWHRMNRAVALTGEWIARVHPQDKKLYWTNTDTLFFTWRKPPPEKWFNYEEGKLLFKLRKYKECKRKLMSYDDPDYHYTGRYIDIAEMHIQDARRKKEAAIVYEEAKAMHDRGHHEEAHHAFEVVDVLVKGQKYRNTAKYLEVSQQYVEVHQKKEEVRKTVASRKTSNYFSRGSRHSAVTEDHKQRSASMLAHSRKLTKSEEGQHSPLLPPPPPLFGSYPNAQSEDEWEDDDDDDSEGEGIEWEWEYEDEEEEEAPPSMPLMPSGGFSWPWETASTAPASMRSSWANSSKA